MTQQVQLPPPATNTPLMTRMVSEVLIPGVQGQDTSTVWVVSKNHPLIPDMQIVRMFNVDGGVEIYSTSNDNKAGMRNFVPTSRVRFTEEVMTLDVFVDELAAAEGEDDEDDEDDEEESASISAPASPPPSNGQPVS